MNIPHITAAVKELELAIVNTINPAERKSLHRHRDGLRQLLQSRGVFIGTFEADKKINLPFCHAPHLQ